MAHFLAAGHKHKVINMCLLRCSAISFVN